MRAFFLIALYLVALLPQAWASGVAVFDYDDRPDREQTTAQYIARQLREKIPAIGVDQYSGKNDTETSIRVLRELDAKGYDLIITITSDALIVAHHTIQQTPTLFTNVNNPLFLGFKSLGPPGGLISGASYYISVEKQLSLYLAILPGLKQLGFIFDLNNKSKKVEVPEVRRVCKDMGIGYKIEVVTRKQELERAACRLMENGAQALAIGSSDMLYNNITRFIDQCNTAKIPVFSFNKKGVNYGALAALSSDYARMADNLIIPMALEVIKHGKSPGDMPIAFLEESRVFINLDQAGKLNLQIPRNILDQAVIIPPEFHDPE